MNEGGSAGVHHKKVPLARPIDTLLLVRAIDPERVRFIVRRIVQPPERPDDPSHENAVKSG